MDIDKKLILVHMSSFSSTSLALQSIQDPGLL